MISRTVASMQCLLKQRPRYCAVVNKSAEPEATAFLTNMGCKEITGLPLTCFIMNSSQSVFPPSPQTKDKLLYYYTMDIASLFPVLALNPNPVSNVLDMCAAPGGKAFALIQMLSLQCGQHGGSLALNDSSQSRLHRLKDVVLSKCLQKEFRHSVRFTQRRGEEWKGIEEKEYDRVLIDAPCSSDRHHTDEWLRKGRTYPNTERLSTLQEKLLLAGLYAAKPGGVVIYSTCTLSEAENDRVVHRVSQGLKFNATPMLDTSVYKPLERLCYYVTTDYGILVTPSEQLNCGPMYICQLRLV